MNKYKDEKTGIYLRYMSYDDTDLIVKWRNSDNVRKYFIYQQPFTVEGHENWINTMIKTGKAVQMMICRDTDGRPLGSVFIRDINKQDLKAEYGIFIGEDSARGKGIGTAAAKLMIDYAFKELKLQRLFLRVFAENEQAIHSYEKAGFTKEAYLHRDVYVEGKFRDIIIMAIINSDLTT